MGKVGVVGFLLYMIIGLLLINYSFSLIEIGFFDSIERWVVLIGGILVIAGGINYIRANRGPF